MEESRGKTISPPWRRLGWPTVAMLGWLLGPPTSAVQAQLGPPVALRDVSGGTLLFPSSEPATFLPAPTLHTDVYLSVTGPVVRAQVTQQFQNPTDEWLEGVYVFPLPETAALDHLRMIVGSRVIEGQIHEREAARQLYEQARQSGTKASLIEQGRPNVFTTSVANIGPGESIQVLIEYQDLVPYDSGEFRLRFPLVVAPRYTPPSDDAQPPAAERLTPSVLPVAGTEPCTPRAQGMNPVTLTVELNPGMPLKWVYSPSHEIATRSLVDDTYLVRLTDAVPADRDFVLVWAPDVADDPRAVVFTEEQGGDTYALVMVVPPDPQHADPQLTVTRLPRDTVFVIDTSGSMFGASLEQAKLTLLIALDNVEPGDRFNVIQFNSVTRRLFPQSVAADPEAIAAARAYVGSLRADGGTEMYSALAAALEGEAGPGWVRQVIFITDGAVSNERQLFDEIDQRLGNTRLFTVGIGSAPNAYFMRKAAQFGRGTFTYIGSPNEVSAQMDALFHKLESPMLSDLAIGWSDPEAEAWPARVPDLYAGEPIVVTARLDGSDGQVFLGGTRADEDWGTQLSLAPQLAIERSNPDLGIAKLWARRKIERLMDSLTEGADAEAVRRAVVDLGLQHHLVTSYTSLVAVDVTPTAPRGIEPQTRQLPLNAPHGTIGSLPQTATAAPLCALLALLFVTLAVLVQPRRNRVGFPFPPGHRSSRAQCCVPADPTPGN